MTALLKSNTGLKSCHQAGAAALAAEACKLLSNDPKCHELVRSCILLAVGNYGNWGKEAHHTFSRLASYLAIHQSTPKSAVVAEIYGQLNIALVCSIARAILARELPCLKKLLSQKKISMHCTNNALQEASNGTIKCTYILPLFKSIQFTKGR